ncbi:MAG: hypothetical protein ACR2JM_09220 [Mycobacterium sp.]
MTPLLITLLAEGPNKTGPDFGKASPIGLLVVVLLLIGVFALVRSMNRHLKRVPPTFGAETPDTAEAPEAPEAPESAGGAGEPSHESGG